MIPKKIVNWIPWGFAAWDGGTNFQPLESSCYEPIWKKTKFKGVEQDPEQVVQTLVEAVITDRFCNLNHHEETTTTTQPEWALVQGHRRRISRQQPGREE